MSAYLIVDVNITNPAAYEEYKNLARPIAEKFGGVYRVRGGVLDVRENALWAPTQYCDYRISRCQKRTGLRRFRRICSRKTYTPKKFRVHTIYCGWRLSTHSIQQRSLQ